ncbi:hypothetical protein [Sulfurimonas sp. C5]|uniref:polysaccharide deacetylase family protein n=1 Tax=Sulfurimonas sp. C5 TaxID=3036947 RepID=UPI002457FDD3|nr:hypothetical protein [Sulfurimonas sp. C5]MDH4944739.1 hypothetical protein [Sulfurimonas sp. C5]
MKHLCCSKLLTLLLLFVVTLNASLNDKSAIVYLGEKISYPMVGIHNYIIVDPKKTNVYTHGFDVYNKKIYARIVLNEISNTDILLENLLDLKHQGFQNFFFDLQKPVDTQNFTNFLERLKKDCAFRDTKIILHSDEQKVLAIAYPYVDTLLLYNALEDPNLQTKIKLYKNGSKDIIDVETAKSVKLGQVIKLGFIPYLTSLSMQRYGTSSKNAFKREILILIDESATDRMESSAHQYGAIPLEYQGYIQSIRNIHDGLPSPDQMEQYAGVVIWLTVDYDSPSTLISWVKEVVQKKIPVVFAHSFGFNVSGMYLSQLGIETYDGDEKASQKIIAKDSMMDYEIKTPLSHSNFYFQAPKNSRELVTFQDSNGLTSTTAAITPWGGYAIDTAFMTEVDGENIWVINPFKFFKEALRLQDIPVPDPTTENGNRLFFTHVDGDGIMNGVEYDSELVSGDIIYSEILKKYNFPHSISVIGAEIMPNGVYPQESKRLLELSSKIYALENVEPATHTFTHPFFWGEIKNGNLIEEYRLKPPAYKFSLDYELSGMLEYIQDNLLEKNATKKAQTVFWSGDCTPRTNALKYVYQHHILNINGGDTTINNSAPWLALVAPFGLERDEYYQIYTGAQNENVFTNDWIGPFWGFKKVIQTFKLTDSPKRLKPIDVYYHLYSGSKKASLNALRYVFDWVLEQNTMPIFTSEYIPKVMDYYTVSIAKDNEGHWLYDGMKDLKTLRIEKKDAGIDLQHSKTSLGIEHFEDHTYIALDQSTKHLLKALPSQTLNDVYLIRANGKIKNHMDTAIHKVYEFSSHVPLKIEFHVPKNCTLSSIPQSNVNISDHNIIKLEYQSSKKATIDVRCQ